MSKQEATRLADALERGGYLGNACNEAAALLRRWPDGEPFGWWRPSRAPNYYAPVFSSGKAPPEPLTEAEAIAKGWTPVYTAPPDRPVPIGPIYCVGNKVSHAYFWRRSDADAFAASAGAAVGLHVWEVQVMGRPPAESERIAARKWLDNECLDGGCQSLKWHERIAALEADRAAALRLANDLTLETQTVEEAVADLVRMVRDARTRIAALEASLAERDRGIEQTRVALRHGIKTINHLGGAVECMPLHDALRKIEEVQK